jgi:hypothetical protein
MMGHGGRHVPLHSVHHRCQTCKRNQRQLGTGMNAHVCQRVSCHRLRRRRPQLSVQCSRLEHHRVSPCVQGGVGTCHAWVSISLSLSLCLSYGTHMIKVLFFFVKVVLCIVSRRRDWRCGADALAGGPSRSCHGSVRRGSVPIRLDHKHDRIKRIRLTLHRQSWIDIDIDIDRDRGGRVRDQG